MKEIVFCLSLIVCVVGWLIWMACLRMTDPPKGLADTGKIMFGVGLFVFLLPKT